MGYNYIIWSFENFNSMNESWKAVQAWKNTTYEHSLHLIY